VLLEDLLLLPGDSGEFRVEAVVRALLVGSIQIPVAPEDVHPQLVGERVA